MTHAKHVDEHKKGIYFTFAAFFMWGLVPIYFKSVSHVDEFEVMAHRIIWSCLFLALFLFLRKQMSDALRLLKRPSIVFGLGCSALVISINWLVFIWAVSQDRIVETTLGYFVNPLISIVFGMIFFNERLRLLQWGAILLAVIGVLYQIILLGELPWVALVLANSFALYGVLRKKIPVDSISGLFIETLWLLPFALIYSAWLINDAAFQFISHGSETTILLITAGLVTSLPLIAFAAGAQRISLTLVGLLQYIGPSIAFMIAVFYYDEPMDFQRLITFVLIWIALALFSIEGLLVQRKKHRTNV